MLKRNVGIAAIVIGFLITAFGGFALAASNLPLNTLVTRAVIVFVVVVPIFLVGIYLYATSDSESADASSADASETELQLQMMDMIRVQRRVSFEDLTAELNVSMATVTHLVEDLDALDLFTGYIDWGNETIYAVRPQELSDANP